MATTSGDKTSSGDSADDGEVPLCKLCRCVA